MAEDKAKQRRFLEASTEMRQAFNTACLLKSVFLWDALAKIEFTPLSDIHPEGSVLEENEDGSLIPVVLKKYTDAEKENVLRKRIEEFVGPRIKQLAPEVKKLIATCKNSLGIMNELLPHVRLLNYRNPEQLITFQLGRINEDPELYENSRVQNLNWSRDRQINEWSTAHEMVSNLMMKMLFDIYPMDPELISNGDWTELDAVSAHVEEYVKRLAIYRLYIGLDHFPDMREASRLNRVAYHEYLTVANHFGMLDEIVVRIDPASTVFPLDPNGPLYTQKDIQIFFGWLPENVPKRTDHSPRWEKLKEMVTDPVLSSKINRKNPGRVRENEKITPAEAITLIDLATGKAAWDTDDGGNEVLFRKREELNSRIAAFKKSEVNRDIGIKSDS